MGVFKNLLIQAEEGDKHAIETLASHCEKNGNINQAILWYKKLGNDKKVEELTKLNKDSAVP